MKPARPASPNRGIPWEGGMGLRRSGRHGRSTAGACGGEGGGREGQGVWGGDGYARRGRLEAALSVRARWLLVAGGQTSRPHFAVPVYSPCAATPLGFFLVPEAAFESRRDGSRCEEASCICTGSRKSSWSWRPAASWRVRTSRGGGANANMDDAAAPPAPARVRDEAGDQGPEKKQRVEGTSDSSGEAPSGADASAPAVAAAPEAGGAAAAGGAGGTGTGVEVRPACPPAFCTPSRAPPFKHLWNSSCVPRTPPPRRRATGAGRTRGRRPRPRKGTLRRRVTAGRRAAELRADRRREVRPAPPWLLRRRPVRRRRNNRRRVRRQATVPRPTPRRPPTPTRRRADPPPA